MTGTKRPKRTLLDMQTDANEYARETFRKTPFHLTTLTDEQMDKIAPAIIQALVTAWAEGYAARNDEKSR